MNDEVRQSKSVKMKPSIVRKAHRNAVKAGKTLGRWIEDTIKEKIEREETREKIERPIGAGLSELDR